MARINNTCSKQILPEKCICGKRSSESRKNESPINKTITPIPLSPEEEKEEHNDYFTTDKPLESPTNEAMAAILPFQSKYTGYLDLTGRFPYRL